MEEKAEPEKVTLVVSIFTGDPSLFAGTLKTLEERFGPIDFLSEAIDFNGTGYYKEEFGAGLKRKLVSFEALIPADGLPAIKTFTDGLEKTLADSNGKRRVNIDPGILTLERFVLATRKNFTHRICIGSNVYADLTLIYSKNNWRALEWTYPDYKTERIMNILTGIRTRYAHKIGRGA